MYQLGRGAEEALRRPSMGLGMAGLAEIGAKIPFRPELEDIAKRAPRRIVVGELGQDPSREPQSIDINPIVEDKLLPRSTQWAIDHPNLVKAKLLREAPDLAAQVSIAMERNDHRTLQKVMPLVAQQLPHVFENSEYGEFDGKIIDPNQRAMFIENVMSDPSIDTYQKAEIIDHLNKTHEVLK